MLFLVFERGSDLPGRGRGAKYVLRHGFLGVFMDSGDLQNHKYFIAWNTFRDRIHSWEIPEPCVRSIWSANSPGSREVTGAELLRKVHA